jgi:hypothetical protein
MYRPAPTTVVSEEGDKYYFSDFQFLKQLRSVVMSILSICVTAL